MSEKASAGAPGLRELASRIVAPVRRRARKQLSILHNPLLNWAAGHVAKFRRLTLLRQLTVIGVTGSCGKTTTTRLIGAILSVKAGCEVRGNTNTLEAAVRSMLSIDRSRRFCVHEVAAYRPGSVARTAKILMPQIGVVTMIGTDHYSSFRGREGVAGEKAALVEALPRTGMAILNLDDPYVRAMAARTNAKVLTFGCSTEADVRATGISADWPDRLRFTVTHGNRCESISTRLVGEHWVVSVLAAIACGIACDVELKDCARVVGAFEASFGRYSVHPVTDGSAYIFDQKASDWTIASSLDFLRKARAPRKTIVFGTISDYPGAVGPRYRRIARDALGVADRVVFVGKNAGHIDKMRTEALHDRLLGFLTAYQASNYLVENAFPGELILIKSSLVADHLERIFLSRLDQVVCWREHCGRPRHCPECPAYRKPSPPPLGLGDSRTAHELGFPGTHEAAPSMSSG